jgi:RHS repeat-associated protein
MQACRKDTNKSMTMAYDAAGRVTSKTDRLGQRIDYVYDNADRLLTETWRNAGGSVVNTLTHVYDSAGNQTLAQDSHGAYTFTYDSLNRASTVKGLFGVTLTFSYDAASNRTKVEDSFGGVLTSVYDGANRLTSQQFGGVSQTPLRFDLAYTERNQVGTLTRYSDLAGSTKVGESDYTYDSVGRLQNLQHKNGSGTGLTTLTYTYTYDLASRVTSETLNGGAPTSYTYDSTNQLTNDGTKAYSYDANGNRTMTGYQTGAGNRLTNDGFYTYTYDDEGNLSKKSKGASAETWNYSYDNRNQLVGVTERSTDGGGMLLFQGTYVYDVFNNRVEADEYTNLSGTTTVTKSIYADPGTVFADLTSGNAMQTRYLHQDDSQYSPVVARIDGGGAAWLLLDRQGSTRNVVNGSGTLIGTVAYDGFGGVTAESDSTKSGAYGYAGYRRDKQLGTYRPDASARPVYDPAIGRWTTRDPSGFPDGPNDRWYVHNNPTNATDPSGEEVWWVARSLARTSEPFRPSGGPGNHTFLVLFPDEPEKFSPKLFANRSFLRSSYWVTNQLNGRRGQFFTLGAFPGDPGSANEGMMEVRVNYRPDVEAGEEALTGRKAGRERWGVDIRPLDAPKEFQVLGKERADTLWIMILLAQVRDFNRQARDNPVEFKGLVCNCQTWAKEMLWASGQWSNDDLIRIGDFRGWDGILGMQGRKYFLPDSIDLRQSDVRRFYSEYWSIMAESPEKPNCVCSYHYPEMRRMSPEDRYQFKKRIVAAEAARAARRTKALAEQLYAKYASLFGLDKGKKIDILQ